MAKKELLIFLFQTFSSSRASQLCKQLHYLPSSSNQNVRITLDSWPFLTFCVSVCQQDCQLLNYLNFHNLIILVVGFLLEDYGWLRPFYQKG